MLLGTYFALYFGAKTFDKYSAVFLGLAGGAYKTTTYVMTPPPFLFTTAYPHPILLYDFHTS